MKQAQEVEPLRAMKKEKEKRKMRPVKTLWSERASAGQWKRAKTQTS